MPILRLSVLLTLAAGLCSCRTGADVRSLRPAEAPAALRYNVTYVREPEHALDVEVVLTRDMPQEFLFTQRGGVDAVWAFSETGQVSALPARQTVVRPPKGTRFLRYRFPLDGLIRRRGPDFFAGLGQGDARHIAGRAWLLRPRVASPAQRVELSLEGVDALLPWEPGPGGLYRLSTEDLVDSGFHSFGGKRCRAQLPGAVMEVAILGPLTHMEDAAVCDWLRRTAEEVYMVRRSFPYRRITVHVVPIPDHDEANVFGMLMWSSPPSISLLVGQDARPQAFEEDWVALHEMLHLTHPAFVPRTQWISEGLATYFTEVARARSGRQTPERTWAELLDGFERGRAQARGRTMQQMIEESRPPGIYWVGAYLSLLIDVELRRVTRNQRQLEDVLELLARQGPTSTPEAYGAAVDAVAGQPIFKDLLSRHLTRPAFAGLEGLLEELGVRSLPGGVKLQPAQDSVLREALDGPRASIAQ